MSRRRMPSTQAGKAILGTPDYQKHLLPSLLRPGSADEHRAWLQQITDNVNRRLRGLPRLP